MMTCGINQLITKCNTSYFILIWFPKQPLALSWPLPFMDSSPFRNASQGLPTQSCKCHFLHSPGQVDRGKSYRWWSPHLCVYMSFSLNQDPVEGRLHVLFIFICFNEWVKKTQLEWYAFHIVHFTENLSNTSLRGQWPDTRPEIEYWPLWRYIFSRKT